MTKSKYFKDFTTKNPTHSQRPMSDGKDKAFSSAEPHFDVGNAGAIIDCTLLFETPFGRTGGPHAPPHFFSRKKCGKQYACALQFTLHR